MSRFPRAAHIAFAVFPLITLAACATVPRIETSLSGSVPAGRAYEVVDGTKYFGASDVPVQPLEQCLGAAGLAKGSAPDVLVQVAHAVRPANARILLADDTVPRRRPRSGDDREELVLAVTDSASGALLLRATAARTLRRGETAGTGADLAATLCGLIPAAGSPGAVSP